MISNVNIMLSLSAIELGLLETVFCLNIKKRPHFMAKALASILLTALYVLSFPIINLGVLIHIPMVVLSFIYIYTCYETSINQVLFIGTAGYTIGHIASLINSMITLLAPDRFAHFGINARFNWHAYALIITCYAAVDAAIYFLVLRKMIITDVLKNATIPIVLLSTVMLAVNQILGLSFSLYAADQAGPLAALLEYIWNLLCCVFCLCIQFGMFQMSKKEQELDIARQLIAEKEQQYHFSKSMIDNINRKCHNLKYELSVLSRESGSERHINDALAMVDSIDASARTGNDTIDVILTEKSQYCQQAGISFVCMVDGEKLDFMDATDQYVLFGNLVDNAINAVQKLDGSDQRVIYINVHAQKKLLFIQTENPFTGEIAFREGLPMTTSGDENNHGFGMVSIRMICEKYNGAVNTKAENGTFYLNIIIPLP